MDTLYYSCKWKIRYVDFYQTFSKLQDSAKSLNITLVSFGNMIEDDAGFYYFWFGISTPSETAFNEFANQSNSLGIRPWKPSNEGLFLTGYESDIRNIEPAMVFSYFESLSVHAMSNERLIDKLSLCNSQNLFVSLEWIIRQNRIPNEIVEVYEFVVSQSCTFYYIGKARIRNSPCYTLKFGIIFQNGNRQEEFKRRFQKIGMEFVNWQPITCDEFFDRSKKISVLDDGWNHHLVSPILLESFAAHNKKCPL